MRKMWLQHIMPEPHRLYSCYSKLLPLLIQEGLEFLLHSLVRLFGEQADDHDEGDSALGDLETAREAGKPQPG